MRLKNVNKNNINPYRQKKTVSKINETVFYIAENTFKL